MRKNLLKSLVAGAAILAASASANAYVMNIGGTDYTFDSIDWSSGGSAWSADYRKADGSRADVGHVFNMAFQSTAAALLLGNQAVYTFDASSPFELTLFASVNETVAVDIPVVGTQMFVMNYGTWSVYQDAAKNANLLTGAGIADGTKVLGGSFAPGFSGGFTATDATSGSGSQALLGSVDAAPFGLVDPHPSATVAVSTLQLGSFVTAALPTGFSNGIDGGTNAAFNSGDITQLVMQLDANQRFVPEPASMALLGLGMAGMAALRRRK
ncbi:MAG: flocculation-associated PEP-CTERM protein PepA [Zoogloea sp.]|uniref:flocculation-associated PEP-CTERM protein PepA n=1 Tax=Zoogloea sp. TaxID=49181 RepID=UPI0026311CF7|nr:flocculation-associated PEP-CTERM protein PepA [Zoogloea sp.]MDD3327320.1 flocculation-associated PEP-CTERM protein PepA [Zoogloea sp.]